MLKRKVQEGCRPQGPSAAEVEALQARVCDLEAALAEKEAQLQQQLETHVYVGMPGLACTPDMRLQAPANHLPNSAATVASPSAGTTHNVPIEPEQAQVLLHDTHAAVCLPFTLFFPFVPLRLQFAAFRVQCPLVDIIEENKAQLRAQHDAAKRAAASAANSKAVRVCSIL